MPLPSFAHSCLRRACAALGFPILILSLPAAEVDFTGYQTDSQISVKHEGEHLIVEWPITDEQTGGMILDLEPGKPLRIIVHPKDREK